MASSSRCYVKGVHCLARDRLLLSCSDFRWVCDLPALASWVARITVLHHQAHLALEFLRTQWRTIYNQPWFREKPPRMFLVASLTLDTRSSQNIHFFPGRIKTWPTWFEVVRLRPASTCQKNNFFWLPKTWQAYTTCIVCVPKLKSQARTKSTASTGVSSKREPSCWS